MMILMMKMIKKVMMIMMIIMLVTLRYSVTCFDPLLRKKVRPYKKNVHR